MFFDMLVSAIGRLLFGCDRDRFKIEYFIERNFGFRWFPFQRKNRWCDFGRGGEVLS